MDWSGDLKSETNETPNSSGYVFYCFGYATLTNSAPNKADAELFLDYLLSPDRLAAGFYSEKNR
jgi:ABC-type Fe3+ transport system substrate-binding protein